MMMQRVRNAMVLNLVRIHHLAVTASCAIAVLTAFSTVPGNVFAQDAVADAPTDAPPKTPAAAPATDAPAEKPAVSAGQADLDEAVIKRIDAETSTELETVSSLLKSAIAKGLDEENLSFAKKMLGSVLLQRGQGLAGEMMQNRGRRQMQIKDEALDSLNQAVKHDPELVEAYLMIARLNMLPEGDVKAILEATSRAIDLLGDEPREQSAAYVLRALTQSDDDKKLADLDEAVRIDDENLEAKQARAAIRLQKGDVDGAITDLEALLTKDPTNQAVAQAAVQQLVELNRTEDALSLITKTLEAKPNEGLYRMRAILYRMEGKEDEALSDLNKALAMQPKDPVSLLQRAEIALSRGDIKSAKQDLKTATQIAPQVADADQAIFVRCLIAIEEKRMADAINDMKLLVSRDPENRVRQLQLSNLYLQDERPRLAIETLSAVIDQNPKAIGIASILRSRADAWLSVGDHVEAIKDYERAIAEGEKDDPDNAGALNNLAWVLATSPKDEIRNGKRAVELGERAAELTEFKEAHILSTLAAGYAEVGNFEKAIEWSTKAVDLGKAEDNPQTEQLQEELESYKQNKPWREKQEVEENKVPILSAEDLIDT